MAYCLGAVYMPKHRLKPSHYKQKIKSAQLKVRMCHKGQILSSRHQGKRIAILVFVHVCFTRQKWRYVAFTDGSGCHAYGHRTFLKQESTEHHTRCTASAILSMRRLGRAVMTAHGALLRVMSIVIFTFTPDGIQHAFMTVRF